MVQSIWVRGRSKLVTQPGRGKSKRVIGPLSQWVIGHVCQQNLSRGLLKAFIKRYIGVVVQHHLDEFRSPSKDKNSRHMSYINGIWIVLGLNIVETTLETMWLLTGYKSEVDKHRKDAVSLSVPCPAGIGTCLQMSWTGSFTLPSISIALCANGTKEAMHDTTPKLPSQVACGQSRQSQPGLGLSLSHFIDQTILVLLTPNINSARCGSSAISHGPTESDQGAGGWDSWERSKAGRKVLEGGKEGTPAYQCRVI